MSASGPETDQPLRCTYSSVYCRTVLLGAPPPGACCECGHKSTLCVAAQRATDATPSLRQDPGYAASGAGSAEARTGNGAGPPAAAEGDVLIELHDVGKAFGKKAILKGATMKIRRGEAVGIIGAPLARQIYGTH